MKNIKEIINDIQSKYPDKTIVNIVNCNDEILEKLPKPLREFYSLYDSAEFPFGSVYPAETALKEYLSAKEVFEGWFCFGFDGYFSFWLCSYEPDDEGFSITPWDHDSGCKIEGAYTDFSEFLLGMQAEYEENYDLWHEIFLSP